MKFSYGYHIYGSKFSGKRKEKKKEKAILFFGNDNFLFGSDMSKNFFLWQNHIIKI